MVSAFLVFVAILSFCWGALRFYEASLTSDTLANTELLIILLYWGIATICFGSAAILDGIKRATQRLFLKLEELAR